MRSLAALFTALLICSSANAQNDRLLRHLDANEIRKQDELDNSLYKKRRKEGVKAYHFYEIRYKNGKTGDTILTESGEYAGKLAKFKTYDRKGRLKNYYEYVYEDERVVSFYMEKKGKPDHKFEYAYNDDGLQTGFTSYWKFHKDMEEPVWRQVSTYNEQGRILEKKSINVRKSKLYYRWVYEYTEDGKKAKVTEYDRRGKVSNLWEYDCDPEGKSPAELKKDTTRVCVRYEDDGKGNTLKVVEEAYPWSKVKKVVYKYNAAGDWVDWASYDKKGRQLERKVREFNAHNKIVSSTAYKKGKVNGLNKSLYNEDGEQIAFIEYKKDGESIKKRYRYDTLEKGTSKTTVYNDKDEVVAVYLFKKEYH